MPSEPNRRFLALDVEEVSLVDEPANLTPFLVLKAMEANKMADNQTAAAPGSATSVEVEQPEAAGGDANVAKALEHVSSIVDKVTKAVGGTPATTETTAETPTEKGGKAAATPESEETETEKGTSAKAAKPPLAKTKKATGETPAPAEAPVEEAPEALTIDSLAEVIHKAKAFTPSRIAQLQKAEEVLKLILQGVAPGQSPATSTPGVSSHSNPNTSATLTKPSPQASVRKDAAGGEAESAGEVVEALKSLGELVKGFGERLDTVEKARPAGNSVTQDETHSKDQPVQKNFWGGVL